MLCHFSFNVCGKVTIDRIPESLGAITSQRRIIYRPEGKGSDAISKVTDAEGKFCVKVKPGKYVFNVSPLNCLRCCFCFWSVHALSSPKTGISHTITGTGIVRKNANFHGSETDFPQREKLSAGKINQWYKKKGEKKKEVLVFAPNTCETYRARSHAAIACLGHVIANTVTCC